MTLIKIMILSPVLLLLTNTTAFSKLTRTYESNQLENQSLTIAGSPIAASILTPPRNPSKSIEDDTAIDSTGINTTEALTKPLIKTTVGTDSITDPIDNYIGVKIGEKTFTTNDKDSRPKAGINKVRKADSPDSILADHLGTPDALRIVPKSKPLKAPQKLSKTAVLELKAPPILSTATPKSKVIKNTTPKENKSLTKKPEKPEALASIAVTPLKTLTTTTHIKAIHTQPEMTIVAKPKVIKPKVIKPKVIKPKVIKPKVIKPKVIKPKILAKPKTSASIVKRTITKLEIPSEPVELKVNRIKNIKPKSINLAAIQPIRKALPSSLNKSIRLPSINLSLQGLLSIIEMQSPIDIVIARDVDVSKTTDIESIEKLTLKKLLGNKLKQDNLNYKIIGHNLIFIYDNNDYNNCLYNLKSNNDKRRQFLPNKYNVNNVKKISLDTTDLSLNRTFNYLAHMTDLEVLIDNQMKHYATISDSINVHDKNLGQILTVLAYRNGLDYEYVNDGVLLVKQNSNINACQGLIPSKRL